MLSGITITCFAASYAVSLGLEISRLFFRTAVRFAVLLGFTIAGLFAHAVYLMTRAEGVVSGHGIPPLSSWFDFCLVAAWFLAAAYVVLTIRRPQNAVGIFLLPLVLTLIGVAVLLRDLPPFSSQAASYRVAVSARFFPVGGDDGRGVGIHHRFDVPGGLVSLEAQAAAAARAAAAQPGVAAAVQSRVAAGFDLPAGRGSDRRSDAQPGVPCR